jgi:hypothetical protein
LRQADTDIQQKSLSAATMTLIMITMAYFVSAHSISKCNGLRPRPPLVFCNRGTSSVGC